MPGRPEAQKSVKPRRKLRGSECHHHHHRGHQRRSHRGEDEKVVILSPALSHWRHFQAYAKDNSKKKASGHSPATNTTPKRRGRAKKEGKACSDSSDDEPLSEPARKKGEPARKKGEPARKKDEPEMKQAVVLLERMSEQDVMDAVARGGTHTQEQKSAARAESTAESSDEEPLSLKMTRLKEQSKAARGRRPAADASSDDEPLVRKVKTAKVKDKFRKRANGEEDTVKQDKELSEEDERPH